LGALADAGGRRRLLLGLFTALMVAATAALWFVHPRPSDVARGLVLVGIATIAFETATVFYNAMLPELAPSDRLGRLSGIAWASGYAGGLCCLTLCLVLLIRPDPPLFGLSQSSAANVRACAILAAAWIALFAWPLLAFGPRDPAGVPWRLAIRRGLGGLRRTLAETARAPALRRFLLARMVYTDGLSALFAFGGIYAAGTFGMDAQAVLLLGIALNVTAGVGAALFALVEDRIGAKRVVLTSLAALLGLGAGALAARNASAFWACALGLGAFVGPVQSASRSLMARLAPAEARNAQFGLYALSGRLTGFIGPAGIGAATALFGSQRAGMAVILLLLGAGAVLLLPLRSPATSASAPPPARA
jgi:UMF1 family MFS transporter